MRAFFELNGRDFKVKFTLFGFESYFYVISLKRLCVLLLSIVCFTGGCAANRQINMSEANTLAHLSFHEMTFEAIVPDKTAKIDINSGCATYQFEEGQSHFRAFRLPDISDRMIIEISSFCHGSFFPVYESIMYPFVLVLDGDFKVTRKLVDGHIYEGHDSWKGICLKSTINLLEKEKYFIIYTSPLLLDRKHSFAMSYGKEKVVSGDSGTKYIPPSGVAGGRLVPYSMDGELEIRIINR